ncbi:hypothetical protein AB6A40_002799 [Gnathostoma spinigerum]|uniref:Uncharacterized protein n=1 Tax=Gnathostoma spinigerum TaxID=75299 RepID=A0ABD6E8U0_9BILA
MASSDEFSGLMHPFAPPPSNFHSPEMTMKPPPAPFCFGYLPPNPYGPAPTFTDINPHSQSAILPSNDKLIYE